MKSESFGAIRLHWVLIVGLAFSMLGVVSNVFLCIVSPGWGPGLSTATTIVLLYVWGVWWRNRSRPPLEITEEEIRYAPQTSIRPRRVPRREIEAIEFPSARRAVVRLRSGGRFVLRLGFLEAPSRARAVAALKEVSGPLTRPA
jgi:hypothetical protein